jgi:hypothetical protein
MHHIAGHYCGEDAPLGFRDKESAAHARSSKLRAACERSPAGLGWGYPQTLQNGGGWEGKP